MKPFYERNPLKPQWSRAPGGLGLQVNAKDEMEVWRATDTLRRFLNYHWRIRPCKDGNGGYFGILEHERVRKNKD